MIVKKLPKISRVLLILFLFHKVTAQEMPNIVPPSPEAASIFKFAETPVSLHTGVPNINISLFEIESGGVTIPISISYHSKGIQVAEIASRVGTGWVLNAGGIISRQVRGYEDEKGTNGYLSPSSGGSVYKDNNGNVDLFTSPLKRANFILLPGGDDELDFDLIPDQYHFNTSNGLSGKFIFDYNDGEILAQNYSNIEIKRIASIFRIIDGKGNIYFFGNNNMTSYDQVINNYTMHEAGGYTVSPPGPQSLNPNTWHLTNIQTQTGQDISFIYESETTRFFRRSYDKYEVYTSGTPPPPSEFKSYSAEVQSEQKRIKEIVFDTGKVVFEYHTENRQDLYYGGNYLKRVKLLDKNDNLIKQYVFDYKYTDSSDIDTIDNTNSDLKGLDPTASKRLFLKSVQVMAANNDTLPAYRFEYDSNKLPGRHSNAQDVWGYYNGKNNGRFLRSSYTGVGTRAVDTIKSGAGLLKKITYPEGGSTNFYYEHNRVYNYYPKSLIYFDNPNPLSMEGVILSTLDYNKIDTLTNLPIYSSNEYRKTFILSEAVVGANIMYNTMGLVCGSGSYSGCKFSISIYNEANVGVVTLHPTPDNIYHNINMELLPPGTYTLVVKPLGPHNPTNLFENPDEFFKVHLKWLEDISGGVNEPIYAGGKRIKKIEYRDSNNSIGITKNYSYSNPTTGKSSGILFGLPNFLGITSVLTNIMGGTYTIFSPNGNIPGSPLATYQGSSLGYGVVTEYLGEGSNTIGKSVHWFTNTPESGDFYAYPSHPPADHEWMRGKEMNVTHYRKNPDGTYSLVRKIENEYLYGGDNPSIFYSLPYRKLIAENLNCDDPNNNEPIELYSYCTDSVYEKNKKMFRLPLVAFYWAQDDFGVPTDFMYKVYHMTGGTLDLKKTKVTDYFDGGNEIITEKEYFYDYNKHYNPSLLIQSTSNNDFIYSRYFYATSVGTENQDMIDKNMLDIPLKIRKSIGIPVWLSEEATVYKKWDFGNHSFLAPELIKTSKGTNTLENRIRYEKYDDKGNPLEVKQENGISIVYLWGYNKAYPIAKIENVTYEEVTAALGTNNISEADLSAINALRTNSAFANAMITTYTYKPLVGVTSITDPRGYTTTYHYDNFNRLEFVKDAAGNILERTQYHYQN